MKKSQDIFDVCINNGLKVNVVCKYGRPPVPLSKDGNVMSDGLVELEKSSFGATCALPFNTWFIKGLEHGTKNDGYYKLLDAVIYEDLNILSNPEYPQFLELSSEDDDLLIPMAKSEPEKETHILFDLIKLCLRVLMTAIKQIFNRVQ